MRWRPSGSASQTVLSIETVSDVSHPSQRRIVFELSEETDVT